jgi:hypothetical protein
MIDWNLQIKILEDVIRDMEQLSVEDDDKFNLEITRLRSLLEIMKLRLETDVVKEYAYMAQSID